ncbi:MAG: prolipoprotein diacylglyceryl transferase [Dehalococcoidia bacterium]
MIEIGIDPVAVSIGSIELRWYGIMVSLAIFTGVVVPVMLAKRDGLGGVTRDQILSIAIWGVIGGLIGARLIHVFDEWDYFADHPGEIIGGAGLGIYGGILGGTLAGAIYARIKGFPVGKLCDISAFGMILAQVVGRIGCVLNGCCYGTPTGLPWGFVWTNPDSDGYADTYRAGVKVHPTQIYELLWDLVVFALIWSLRNRIKRPGVIYLIYISAYSIGRFTISFWRENHQGFLGLQQAQIVSLAVLAVALGLMVYIYRKPPPETDQAPDL